MKSSTLIGVVVGGAVLGAAGIAVAKTRKDKGDESKAGDKAPDEPFFSYTMQPGDTLSELALKFFGDAKKWPVIAEQNAALLASDEKVPAGAKLRIPCQWVKVQKGETLAAIAKRVLGDGRLWRRIMEANRNASSTRLADPNKLAVGQKLAVPKEGAAVTNTPPVKEGASPVSGAVSVGSSLGLLAATCAAC